MNPGLLVVLILLFSNSGKGQGPIGKINIPSSGPNYIDTFKMELLLDRLRNVTDSLERVNRLNQMKNVPFTKDNALDRIQESLDAVRGLLADGKSLQKVNKATQTISAAKKFGNMESMMSSMGPILSMLSDQDEE
ncbi:MAG: hypothetical protein ACOX5F_08180 [Anaerovoracaceae bacterium]|jgi:hypothetical protein